DDDERLQRFVQRFRRRQLCKRVLVLPYYLNASVQSQLIDTWFAPGRQDARREWEVGMEREALRRFGRSMDVLLYCPARAMQLKEAKTLVRFPGAGDRTLPLDSFAADIPRLRDLRDAYPRMWKLYVFTSEPDKVVRRQLQEMCLQALPAGVTNALKL
ncbi:MAG: hypothetical protein ABL997_08515, partial [Planctomycetota bacterium]